MFPDWRRHVAIKVLVADAGALGRREAAMLALLQGAPGVAIPEFYGAFESGPHYCIAMEACGPSLAAVTSERGALGERAVRRVATQLAAVLAPDADEQALAAVDRQEKRGQEQFERQPGV